MTPPRPGSTSTSKQTPNPLFWPFWRSRYVYEYHKSKRSLGIGSLGSGADGMESGVVEGRVYVGFQSFKTDTLATPSASIVIWASRPLNSRSWGPKDNAVLSSPIPYDLVVCTPRRVSPPQTVGT